MNQQVRDGVEEELNCLSILGRFTSIVCPCICVFSMLQLECSCLSGGKLCLCSSLGDTCNSGELAEISEGVVCRTSLSTANHNQEKYDKLCASYAGAESQISTCNNMKCSHIRCILCSCITQLSLSKYPILRQLPNCFDSIGIGSQKNPYSVTCQF